MGRWGVTIVQVAGGRLGESGGQCAMRRVSSGASAPLDCRLGPSCTVWVWTLVAALVLMQQLMFQMPECGLELIISNGRPC